MRGAGCTYNDLADHAFDAKVQRTKARPLPSGAISRRAAMVFLVLQLLAAAAVLFQFNRHTIILGLLSLALVAIYPFMKRLTYMPQFFLGLAFSWGILMGYSATHNALPFSAFLLYAASIFWVIGYDTIYALQDKEDDLLVGLKSSAILFGDRVKAALAVLYALAFGFFILFGLWTSASLAFYVGMFCVALHFAWQIKTLNEKDSISARNASAFRVFRSNRSLGILVFASLAANSISQTLSGA